VIRSALVHGLRWLRRRPTSSVVSIACLALGIALTTTSWALIDAVLRHPYGLVDVDRLAMFWESDRTNGRELIELSLPDVQDWQARAQSFDSLAAMGSSHWPALAKIHGETVTFAPRAVTRSFFATLGVNPLLGRVFDTNDLLPSTSPPIILSHPLWRARFGEDRSVIGATLFLDGIEHRIVGVMAPGFAFPESPDAWISVERSLGQAFEAAKLNEAQQRELGVLLAIGRLRSEISLERARSELQDITLDVRRDRRPTPAGWTIASTPFSDALLGGVSRRTWIALWMSLAVFAFACANVAAVRLAVGAERQTELLARLALGASRGRIIVELAIETVPIVVCAAMVAVMSAMALSSALPLVPAIAASGVTLASGWVMARPLIALTVASWLATGLATALLITLKLDLGQLTMARPTVTADLRAGAAIVAVQVAFSILTVALAGAAIQAFDRLSSVNVGFSIAGVTVADIALPDSSPEKARMVQDRLLRGLESLPGVSAVGGASLRPFRFGEIGDGLPIRKPQDATVDVERAMTVNRIVISGSYFGALGVPLLLGRDFSTLDRADTEPVVIVSRSVAQALWGTEPAVGRKLQTYTLSEKWKSRLVIGVVGDARYRSLIRPPFELYMPVSQAVVGVSSYVIRTADGRVLSDAEVRAAVRQVDADMGVQAVQPTSAIVRSVLGPAAFVARTLSFLGAAGLLLLALGVFGAVAVQLRSALREIGVRQSLGATPIGASARALRVLSVAIIAGVVAGVVSTPFALEAASRLGLGPKSSTVLQTTLAVGVVTVSALIAAWPLLRRVLRVSPAVLLRQE
jgi:putative ABC transport system permease protein